MEKYINKQGRVIGVDEAGRGCLAGPVVAACVVLPDDYSHPKLNDSKKLSRKVRKELYKDIITNALNYGIGTVENDIIDQSNILAATMDAMHVALEPIKPLDNDIIIVDGNYFKTDKYLFNHETIVKGDGKYIEIAAASIIAKEFRDLMMEKWHDIYPQFNWGSNMGYGNKVHIDAINEHGFTPLHRKSFQPLRGLLENGLISECKVVLNSSD